MEINVIPAEGNEPISRIHVVTITIRSFKGRSNVDVHLFRYCPDMSGAAEIDWNAVTGTSTENAEPAALGDVKQVVMECFTEEERDAVMAYINERYHSRLECITACPIELPVPLGVAPLSSITEDKGRGYIRFDEVPNFTMPFAFRGFYDLSQHEPMVAPSEDR